MRKRLNIKAAGILLGVLAALVVGVHFLHGYQVRSNAGFLRDQAERSEKEDRLDDAIRYLGRYAALVPSDTDARCDYAMLLANEKVAKTPGLLLRAYFALSRAVQLAPERHDARRRLISVAMDRRLGRFKDAEVHIAELLQKSPDPVLFGLQARCLDERAEYTDARKGYEKAIAEASGELENYVRLADLLRTHSAEVRREQDPKNLNDLADKLIEDMAKVNAGNYKAHLIRARYYQNIPVSPAERDAIDAKIAESIDAARKLKPNEVEVILAYADLKRDADPQVARRLLRDGIALHPNEWALVQALAHLENQTGHPETALQCLRDGLKQMPDQLDLLWNYANLLIQHRHKKEAAEIITKLGKAGMPRAQLAFLDARMHFIDSHWRDAALQLERVYPLFLRSYDDRKNWFSLGLALECNFLLGTCYEQLGDPYRAAMAYERVVMRAPRSLAGRLGLARMKWANGQLDAADKEYRLVVGFDNAPASAWVELIQLSLMRNYLSTRPNWQGVRDLIKVAKTLPEKRRPSQATLALLDAEALAGMNNEESYTLARKNLEQVKDAQGQRPTEVWVGLAGLQMQRNQHQSAGAILDEAAKKLGDRVELRVARARVWAHKGGADALWGLEPLAENLTRFNVDEQVQLLRALADAYTQIGAYKDAANLWRMVATRRPNELSCQLALFDMALLRGKDAEMDEQIAAIRKLEEGDEEGKDNAQGSLWRYCRACKFIWLAEHGHTEHLDEASQLLKIVAEGRASWSRVPLAQGQIDEHQGRRQTAIENYRLAMRLGEQRPAVMQQMVRMLTAAANETNDTGYYPEVVRLVKKLETLSPTLLKGLERAAAEAMIFGGAQDEGLKLAQKGVKDSKDYRDHLWYAQTLSRAGLDPTGKAIEAEVRRAVAMADNVPETWQALVEYLKDAGKTEEAKTTVRQAELKLKDTAPAGLARCYERIGDTAKAKELYAAALAAQPEDAKVLLAVAKFCATTGRRAEAEKHVNTVVQGKRGDPADLADAYRLLAILNTARGNPQAGLKMLEHAHDQARGPRSTGGELANKRTRLVILASEPSARSRREAITIVEELHRKHVASFDEEFLLAQLHASVGDWLKARGQLATLLAAVDNRIERTEQPKAKQALKASYCGYAAYYALQLVQRGALSDAEPILARLNAIEPDSWRTLEVKARLLGKRKQGAEAVRFLRAAADRDSTLVKPVAHVLEQIGQFGPAQEMFEKYAADTKEPERVLVLAQFLARRDQPAKALELCERAWKTCAPEAVANTSVAVVYVARSGNAHAEQVASRLDEAIGAHPAKTELLSFLASVRRLQGRHEDSIKLLRQVCERDKSNWVARNNLAWVLALTGKADEALEAIAGAVVLRGEQTNLLETRAVAYIAKGKYALAIDDLQEAVTQAPTASRYFYLAKAQLGAKNLIAARTALEQGTTLGLTEASVEPLERTSYREVLAQINRR